MEIKVTKNKIHLDDKSKLNENEYNINNIDFTFSEEYTQELVKIALFSANNTNYKEIITQNQCKIPSEILANEGVFVLGVYAYSTEDVYKLTEDTEIDEDKTYYTRTGSGTEEEPYEYTEVENPIAENLSTYYEKNVKLSLRYSPSPIKLVVDSGSYIPDEQTQNSEPITASELEQYQQALNDGLREAENVNISAEKVDKVATITIIDRYGDETSVEIQDGTDGIDGKDAKINGVNTLTIKAGQNIEIEQEENTLIINGQSNYNNLTNKPKINNVELTGNKTTSDLGIVIPDVSGFITKDVNNLTNYTLKTATGSLIDLEINQSTYVVTLTLKDIDGNVISTDTIDLPLESVVVGGSYDATNKKIVLTLENGNTVDIPVGDLIAGLQTEITSQNKLSSDLIDDSNSGNKFVNTSEKNSWNAKYDKPNGGIPKTDLASAVQTSLDKADTAVQDVSDKEDVSNKVTEIDETSTDTEYPSAKLLYDELAEKQEQIDGLVTENALLKDQIPNGTAEGTNVQITDSSNLPIEDGMLKGNTSQETTTGKNLFKPIANATKQGVTLTYNEDGSYTLDGTADANTSFYITNLGYGSGTYVMSANNQTINSSVILQAETSSGNVNFSLDATNKSISFIKDDINVLTIVINNGAVLNNFKIFPQLELGSSATSFEKYTGGQPSPNPDYKQDIHTVTGDCEVEVVNKNLCNGINQNTYLNFVVNQCGIADGNSGLYIKVNGETYTISTTEIQTRYRVACTTLEPSEIAQGAYNGQNKDNTSNSITINTSGYNYLVVNATDLSKIQIEKSSTATAYTPHAHQTFPISLGTIELCKIGDYQDYLYKNNGKWYKHKEIEKIELDGTEYWMLDSTKEKTQVFHLTNIINPIATNVGYCNYFIFQLGDTEKFSYLSNLNDLFIAINKSTASTVDDFKAWLSTHNLNFYYPTTPTDIKITDTTLIAQLEAYYNSSTYRNITNIITTGDDLAPIASIVYKKDLTTLFNKLDSLEARVDLLE